LLDHEAEEGILGMPVARIMRDGTGHFIYDPDFIPPLATIAASERLMHILKRLVEILDEKSASLSKGSATAARNWAEYSTRDIAQFWQLHTINSAWAPLREIYSCRHAHPERLFVQMLRLAGALCTFSNESHPRDLPVYNHSDLTGCFDALDHHIRTHLEIILPTNVISIPLQKTSNYLYAGEIKDQRCLDRARWIFSICSATGEVEIISKTSQMVKICSKQFVPRLVEKALPGMGLTHLPSPPSEISAKVDAQYFSISRSGPCWEHIVLTRQVGVYVPGDLPDPELELLVILESK
jgi:type VI secretion system protein ImpJ